MRECISQCARGSFRICISCMRAHPGVHKPVGHVTECVYELVDKGQPTAARLDMLRSLRVIDAVTAVDVRAHGDMHAHVRAPMRHVDMSHARPRRVQVSDDAGFAADVAALVASVGCALLECWQEPEVRVRV